MGSNDNIKEFTCNDCQEVSKVDWSKVRPDLDDGSSNIEICEKGNGYAYYGECMNCGNLVEIEPPVPELIYDNVEVDKDGIYIELLDKVTNRTCWIEAWKDSRTDEWDYNFNQYIFHLDSDIDIVSKMFQEELNDYADDVYECVMYAIEEYEDEYNKLQENKAPTMIDRLKEAKRNKCEHKKTEVLEGKNQEVGVCPVCGNTDLDYGDTVMEQVGDYYGYNWKCSKCNHTGTEWYYMSFVDVYNTNTGEESHQEGICPDCGSDLMYDNFVPDGMDGYYEVYCDNCGFTGKEDYNLDFTDHTVNEEINESKEVKTETLHTDQKEKLSDGTTRIKLVDDGHEQWFIVKAVKDNGVIDYDYDHDVEQADEDRDYFDSSVNVNDIEEILLKTMKESKKVIESDKVDYSKFTPTGKVLSGDKGLSEKQINEIRTSLPKYFKDMTDEQKQIWTELSLRGMVMSCLVYGDDIHTATSINAVSKYYRQPYVNEYYDTLGKDVTEEIIKQQTDYFNKGKVIKNVHTDSEGVTYNSFVEPEEESKKVTEAEDMTAVKDDVESAVEKSDSTKQEIDQVKGSLDVLKTDEESAIDGYEEFNKETAKVVDKPLADRIAEQMQEIIDDEKEHIEKIDTIKSALGESKRYGVYVTCGENGNYSSKLVDTVDNEEQAQDRVAELQAETGCGASYKELTESKLEEIENVGDNMQSNEFWVGDPCYVLSDDIYDNIWGKKYNYQDGLIDCGNGLSFNVHGTAYGDGCYEGSNGFMYCVDSGTIAVIPKELVVKEDGIDSGSLHKSTNGEIEYDNGVFRIEFDNEILEIDTDPSDEGDDLEESKKEELLDGNLDINIDANDIASNNNLDLGDLGTLAGLMASEEPKESEDKLEEAEETSKTATQELNTDLVPIINMFQYEIYNLLDGCVGVTREKIDEMMLDFAKPVIEEEIKDVLPSATVTFKDFTHPRYYRAFSNNNDVLNFDVTYNVSEYETLKEQAIQDPNFEKYLQEHYTSYDGFMSFFANNIKDFEEQEDWKQFVSVLSYYLPNDWENNQEDMYSYVFDHASDYDIIVADSEIESITEEINDKVSNGEMELNKDSVIKYIREIENGWLDEDDTEVIIDGVLEMLNLTESKNTDKKITESLSKEDIMQCYISEIMEIVYTYESAKAQEELDFKLDDLKSDKDLDKSDKEFILKVIRPAILDKDLKLGDINFDKVEEDCTQAGSIQGPTTVFGSKEKKEELVETNTLVKSSKSTNNGWKNNATLVYGELNDGNYFTYIPDSSSLDIWDEEITDKYIVSVYAYGTDEEDADDKWYDKFKKEHDITDKYDRETLIKIEQELDKEYLDESKSTETVIEESLNT